MDVDKLHILTCARRYLPTGPDSSLPGRTKKPPSAHLPLYVDTIKFSVWFSQQLLQPRGVFLVRSRPTPSLRKQPTATRSLQTLTDRYIKEPPHPSGLLQMCRRYEDVLYVWQTRAQALRANTTRDVFAGGTERSDGGIHFYFLRRLTSWVTSQREGEQNKNTCRSSSSLKSALAPLRSLPPLEATAQETVCVCVCVSCERTGRTRFRPRWIIPPAHALTSAQSSPTSNTRQDPKLKLLFDTEGS